MEATEESVAVVNDILEIYEKGSGQNINRDKSSVLFSKNTSRQTKEFLLQLLGLQNEGQQGKYWGLPCYVGKSRQACF